MLERGERGIKVCERWNDFRNFLEDMGPRPEGLTLDRKDNNDNHEPSNCRWTTRKEQRKNSRSISRGPFKQKWFCGYGPSGEIIIEDSQSHVAKVFGLDRSTISGRLNGKYEQHKEWTFQWI